MAIEERPQKGGGKKYRVIIRVFQKKVGKTFTRKIDAERWEREMLHKRDSSGDFAKQQTPTELTVDQFFERYTKDYMELRLAQSTRITSGCVYRNHIRPYLANECMSGLTTKHIREFIFFLSNQLKLSNERVNRARRLLHGMFNRAVEWELVPSNPVTVVKQLPSKRHIGDEDINYLSYAEVERLLEWIRCNDSWLYPKTLLLVNTGIRIGEMIALRVGDLRKSSSSSVLIVSRTYCRLSYQMKNRTKGNRSRAIPLGEGTAMLLDSLSTNRQPDEPLLWDHWGEGKHHTKFTKHFKTALKASGVRRIRVHDLRHTFAVHFLENGGQLYDLQKILGHQSIQLTERYSHFSLAMSERSRGLVDHHGNPRVFQPRFTVIDGGNRIAMSPKCPQNEKNEVQSAQTVLN